MPDWATFTGFVGVVLGLLLLLAHASQSLLSDGHDDESRSEPADDESADWPAEDADRPGELVARFPRDDGRAGESIDRLPGDDGVDDASDHASVDNTARSVPDCERVVPLGVEVIYGDSDDGRESGRSGGSGRSPADSGGSIRQLSTAALLANVAFSQGLFGLLLLAGAWFTGIPASAFGVTPASVAPGVLAVGVGLGVALYVANELGATLSDRVGLGRSEELRAALAPDSWAGWAILLLVVLPIIAGFEELLFRGALVGALAAGFGFSPWLLAAFSSVAFALGHGAQGPAGIVVTGLLGFVLAAAFVLTGSLAAVIVAHYLVNALEFVVHEGLGWDWIGG